MDVVKTLRPLNSGRHYLLDQWNNKPVAARYRQRECTRQQYTSIESIVDQREASLPNHRRLQMSARHRTTATWAYFEARELQQKVKVGGDEIWSLQ